jgi:outer membrane protein assembly factor BamB
MAGPVTAGGLVVATDSRGYVETFDAGSGAARWSRQFSESTSVTPAVSSDTVAVAIGGQVKLLDARTGHPRATIHARAASPPVIAGDTVVVAARDSLASYRLADGALVASAHLPARSSVSLALAMSDDSLVVSTTVEPPWPTTAELAFPFAGGPKGGVRFTGDVTPVPAPPQWPPVDAEGALAFVGGNGVVYRGDRPLLPAGTTIPPFIVSDGPTLYTEHGTDLVAIDAVTGAQRWKFPLGPALPASVPAVDGPNLVVPIAGVGLAALDRSTGKPVWFQTITDTQGVSSPLVLPGGDVVYAVGGIQRFDGTTGTPRWTVPNLDTVSPPGYIGSTVFAVAGPPDGSASLYAIDADTGTVRWQRPARIQLLIGPVAAGDVVLVPNGQSLLALDAATGTPRWSVAVPTGLAGAPAVLGNRVFVDETGSEENAGLHDHRVSAWDLSTGQFLGAFEPTGSGFGHDAFTLSGDRLLVSATSDRGASIFSLAPAGAP